MVVDAFANRSVTASWIYGQAGYLVSEYPSLYLPALARVTASLSEERLQMVLTSLHSHLAAGRVSARAQGLDAVREGVRTRENLPAHLRSLDPPAN